MICIPDGRAELHCWSTALRWWSIRRPLEACSGGKLHMRRSVGAAIAWLMGVSGTGCQRAPISLTARGSGVVWRRRLKRRGVD